MLDRHRVPAPADVIERNIECGRHLTHRKIDAALRQPTSVSPLCCAMVSSGLAEQFSHQNLMASPSRRLLGLLAAHEGVAAMTVRSLVTSVMVVSSASSARQK